MLPMTYDEFKRQLGKSGLSIKAFAELIKQNPVSITNHAAKGEVPPHLAIIATLMGEMVEHGLDVRATLSRVQFDAAKPRGSSVKGTFGGIKHDAASIDENRVAK
jgi:hypothetical protein